MNETANTRARERERGTTDCLIERYGNAVPSQRDAGVADGGGIYSYRSIVSVMRVLVVLAGLVSCGGGVGCEG